MSAEGAQESQNPSDVGSGEVQIPKPQFQQQTGNSVFVKIAAKHT